MSIDPTRAQYKRFALEFPQGEAVLMLNLIRFRERASYPERHPNSKKSLTGKEAYDIYLSELKRFLDGRGAKMVFKAKPQVTLDREAALDLCINLLC